MLYYDRTDIFKGVEINKIKGFSFNDMYAMAVMMYEWCLW